MKNLESGSRLNNSSLMTEIFCRILAQSRVFQDFLVHTKIPFENKPTVGHGRVKFVKTTLDLWKKNLQIRNMIILNSRLKN